MARIKEHEFKSKTKTLLARRANNSCSNPDCRRQTISPKKDDNEGVVSTGIAAHICANSENGPRFSKNLKPDEIRSIDNGIWLCSDCATLIDREPSSFTVELLKQWKSAHENFVRGNYGKKLPSESDAINTLTQALTGSPSLPTSTAIKNTHLATERHLEQLDDRFKIESSYSNGTTHYAIHAKEICDVQISMAVPTESKAEFESAWAAMFTEGKRFVAPIGTKFNSDSKLMNHLLNMEGGDGELSISPVKREAIHKLAVFNNDGIQDSFEDAKGFVSIGNERYRFEGSCCKNYLQVSYSAPIQKNIKTQLNFSTNWAAWNGLSYKRLPYFSKLFKFFDALHNGWTLETSLEIDGEEVFTSKTSDRNEIQEFASSVFNELYFYRNLKVFLEATNQDLFFQEKNEFSGEFAKMLYDFLNILNRNGKPITQEQITKKPSFKLKIDNEEGLKLLLDFIKNSVSKGSLKISNPAINFPVNGQNLLFPPKETYMSGFKIETSQPLKIGTEVTLDVIPGKNFYLVQTININN